MVCFSQRRPFTPKNTREIYSHKLKQQQALLHIMFQTTNMLYFNCLHLKKLVRFSQRRLINMTNVKITQLFHKSLQSSSTNISHQNLSKSFFTSIYLIIISKHNTHNIIKPLCQAKSHHFISLFPVIASSIGIALPLGKAIPFHPSLRGNFVAVAIPLHLVIARQLQLPWQSTKLPP